jgi:uncharacterized membrane protein
MRVNGLAAAGTLLGVAFGAFFDGILFHQVLRWHHMLSTAPDLALRADRELNLLADGLFHLAAYALAVAGLLALWRARRALLDAGSGRRLAGWMLAGAGAFNLVEGIVNHHLLGIHRVHPAAAAPALWDFAFLLLGLALAAGGLALARSGVTPAGSARRR